MATEFDAAPVPKITPTVLRATTDDQLRQTMAEPDFTDDNLNFGPMTMLPGRAFELAGESVGVFTTNQFIPVGKQWQVIDGRTFLFEQVEYPAVLPLLKTLPDAKQARVNSTNAPTHLTFAQTGRAVVLNGPEPPRTLRTASLPVPPPHQRVFAAALPAVPAAKPATSIVQLAQAVPHSRGVAIDYTILGSQTVPFTFQGDVTYAVVSGCFFSAAVSLEGGAVIKSARYNQFTPIDYYMGVNINSTGSLICRTTPYRPSIFTCKDDDSVGEVLPAIVANGQTWPGSTGNISGSYAYRGIIFWSPTASTDVHDVRFRNAVQGYSVLGATAGTLHTLRHAQVINSEAAIVAYTSSVALRNVLVYNSSYGAAYVFFNLPGQTFTAENVTFDSNYYLFTPNSSNPIASFNNCLITGYTSTGSGTYSGNGNFAVTSNAGIYQTVGAGAHYLANNTYRNIGTTSIDATLLNDLKSRTTYPPIVRTTDFAVNTTLLPDLVNVPRDIDTPDIGYHYDALDEAWSNLNLNNNLTLVLTNGFSVAVYGTKGLTVKAGAKLISEGTPTALNRLVRYQTVQEQPTIWGTTASSMSLLGITSGTPFPEVRLRFTDVSIMADSTTSQIKKYLLQNNNLNAGAFTMTDCQLRGVYLDVASTAGAGMTVAFTNNLVLRSKFNFSQAGIGSGQSPFTLSAYNNTFYGGSVSLTYSDSTTAWTLRDNLFDGVTLTSPGGLQVTHDHNAYAATSVLPGSTSANITTNLSPPLDYQGGPAANWYGVEGGYYCPTGGVKLSQLIDWDTTTTRTPATLGLFHYTVKTAANSKEGTDTLQRVDLGYHYVGVNSLNQPIDTDADGAPDYWEDRNGNGVFDQTPSNPTPLQDITASETDWNHPATLVRRFDGSTQETCSPPIVPDPTLVPDTMGAVGPRHYVVCHNGCVRVFGRDGQFTVSTSVESFFGVTSPTTAFDPRILFDAQSGHWFAVALEGPAGTLGNAVRLAVTSGTDPTDPVGAGQTGWENLQWTKSRITDAAETGYFADFTRLGIDDQGVYIVVNYETGALRSTIVAIRKASLFGGLPDITPFHGQAPNGVIVQPCINFDPVGPNGAAWFIGTSAAVGFGLEDIDVGRLQWNAGVPGAPTWSDLNITTSITEPVGAPQKGNTIYQIWAPRMHANFRSAPVVRNSSLWAARCVGLNATGSSSSVDRDGCEWLRLDSQGTSLILGASGRIWDSTATKWSYYCPSLAVNTRGDVLMGFSGSSLNDFMGAFYALKVSGQTSFGAPQLYRPGEDYLEIDDYPDNPLNTTRIGDYSNTCIDPNDGITFWTIQERARIHVVRWGTTVGAISPY
ncbi:MAG: hypothetical protein HY043_22155 [Verrucomicrobia bacterium]|nr:hypothetical protein [Verrucomicrobiota bacterium]